MQLKFDEFYAEKEIPANDSVRLLDQIVEEMNLTPLWSTYKRTGRKPATSPATLLKILLYANMECNYSSRGIESACKRDINYIWLLNGEKAPNYHEINRFRGKRLPECAEALHYELVKKLRERGEIIYEHLFVDGTKIEANANKYSFVWKKSITKYEARTLGKLEKLIGELCLRYGILNSDGAEVLAALEERMGTQPPVHGRGKRKSQLQRDTEELSALLEKKAKYAAYQDTFKGRNSFSKTDPDATFMHMKEDHMRNSQLKPGYNIQLGVEGEYITGVSVSSERSDQLTLIDLMENMHDKLGEYYGDVTADAGYESEENYTWFEDKPCECYIKPQNYERSKTKKYKSNMALRENMAYDAEHDEYTCKGGKKLRPVYTGTRKSKSGFESEVTYYECECCEGCPYRKKCTKSKGNRKLQVSKKFIVQRERSLKRITGENGVMLRINRSIQSEGAFGVIKQNYAFRQFLLRGGKKVFVEILLVAMGYNVNKLHAKIQQHRTGKQLFEKLLA
jgi:Transposase and inactivated derivatives